MIVFQTNFSFRFSSRNATSFVTGRSVDGGAADQNTKCKHGHYLRADTSVNLHFINILDHFMATLQRTICVTPSQLLLWTFNLRLHILIRQYIDCYLPVFFSCMRELCSKSPSGRLIKDSTFPLWHLIKFSLEASGLVFSEVMNYSPSSWQMKRLASCPRSAWYLTACLLCTPGSVCTINTAVVVTAGPPRGRNELQPQHHQHPHHWHTWTHLPGESRYLCTCGRRSLRHITSFPKEETRRGSIDSLFLSTSSFLSIM